MTRAQVFAWLDMRRPVPPAALRERLNRAIEHQLPAPNAQLPAYLAQLGRGLLDSVMKKPTGGRELALDLLAADAFTTYAFEARAEEGKEAVA